MDESGRYRLLDMHFAELMTIDEDQARDLIQRGYARTYSNRYGKGVMGLILKVPLSVVDGNPNGQRSLSLANLTGTKFVFRGKISTPVANFYSYRHKRMHRTEAPEYALARIMHSPAVEGPVYRLKSEQECPQAIPEERGKLHICGGSRRSRARSVAAPAPTRLPLRPPILALAA